MKTKYETSEGVDFCWAYSHETKLIEKEELETWKLMRMRSLPFASTVFLGTILTPFYSSLPKYTKDTCSEHGDIESYNIPNSPKHSICSRFISLKWFRIFQDNYLNSIAYISYPPKNNTSHSLCFLNHEQLFSSNKKFILSSHPKNIRTPTTNRGQWQSSDVGAFPRFHGFGTSDLQRYRKFLQSYRADPWRDWKRGPLVVRCLGFIFIQFI